MPLGQAKNSHQQHQMNLRDWEYERVTHREALQDSGLASNDALKKIIRDMEIRFNEANSGYYRPSVEAARGHAATFHAKLGELKAWIKQSKSPPLKNAAQAYYDFCSTCLNESSRLAQWRVKEDEHAAKTKSVTKVKPNSSTTAKLVQMQQEPKPVAAKPVASTNNEAKSLKHVQPRLGGGRLHAPVGGVAVLNGHTGQIHDELAKRTRQLSVSGDLNEPNVKASKPVIAGLR